jgi:hypothetical protein
MEGIFDLAVLTPAIHTAKTSGKWAAQDRLLDKQTGEHTLSKRAARKPVTASERSCEAMDLVELFLR